MGKYYLQTFNIILIFVKINNIKTKHAFNISVFKTNEQIICVDLKFLVQKTDRKLSQIYKNIKNSYRPVFFNKFAPLADLGEDNDRKQEKLEETLLEPSRRSLKANESFKKL
ncbi:Hypothetical_protein [Hexamita inflata]|uniref:Hypothetical_protein n=1 Tax=Hexamita inflata TaxID=28002 RepID=A0AA86TII7_9EUKA|nr:Hypothetical protein HINF_LOCUS6195 [Hexamita inflata]CAI9918581.1 Hypothetical protein HINF_LOCUS6226 [Hexamita inflata]